MAVQEKTTIMYIRSVCGLIYTLLATCKDTLVAKLATANPLMYPDNKHYRETNQQTLCSIFSCYLLVPVFSL